MTDENNGFITKSKLTIIVKTLSKYNDRNRVAGKQTYSEKQKLKNIWIEKMLKKKINNE